MRADPNYMERHGQSVQAQHFLEPAMRTVTVSWLVEVRSIALPLGSMVVFSNFLRVLSVDKLRSLSITTIHWCCIQGCLATSLSMCKHPTETACQGVGGPLPFLLCVLSEGCNLLCTASECKAKMLVT